MNLIHDIPPVKSDGEYRMVVENPKGSSGKYEVDEELGVIKLDRILSTPMSFPFEYGFIPGTWSKTDDDPLDVMVIMPIATFSGCILDVRVIGLYKMVDTGDEDDKILAVCQRDEKFKEIKDVGDLPSSHIQKIEFFWENYKKLSPERKTEGRGWSSKDEAETFIKNGISYYKKKFGEK